MKKYYLIFAFCYSLIQTYPVDSENIQRAPYYHKISAIHLSERQLEIDDGSIWKIAPLFDEHIKSWNPRDFLVIYPTYGKWITNHRFWLFNMRIKKAVHAEIITSPNKSSRHANHIHAIEPGLGQIYLSNGEGKKSLWQISCQDLHKIERWEKGESITIGSNNCFLGRWIDSAEYLFIHEQDHEIVKADFIY